MKRLTLITNISFLQRDNLRLECSAVLIEDGVDAMFGEQKQFRVRGFGPDGAWLIFTLWLDPETAWELSSPSDSRDSAVMLHEGGQTTPIFSGARLIFTNSNKTMAVAQFFVQTEDGSQPIDVQDVTEIGFPEVWQVLTRKAVQYWHAPNMPYLRYAPVKTLRSALEEWK